MLRLHRPPWKIPPKSKNTRSTQSRQFKFQRDCSRMGARARGGISSKFPQKLKIENFERKFNFPMQARVGAKMKQCSRFFCFFVFLRRPLWFRSLLNLCFHPFFFCVFRVPLPPAPTRTPTTCFMIPWYDISWNKVSAHFGFKDECKMKYGLTVYYRFLLAFQVRQGQLGWLSSFWFHSSTGRGMSYSYILVTGRPGGSVVFPRSLLTITLEYESRCSRIIDLVSVLIIPWVSVCEEGGNWKAINSWV